MKNLLYIAVLVTFPILSAFGQAKLRFLVEELPKDTQNRDLHTHLSIQPRIQSVSISLDTNKRGKAKSHLSFFPLADLGYRSYQNQYRTMLGVGTEYNKGNDWYGRFSYLQGIENGGDIFRLATPFEPGQNGEMVQKLDLRGRVSYTPNRFVNLQAGYDENFIGEGQRSLLLSDYGKPLGFGQVRLNFWRAEYLVLYQFMRERIGSERVNKFGTTHYLNVSATKWLQFGLFETVFFGPTDTLLNRGFEPEYLNPMIFFRPQEYALGSSDNVLIGFDMAIDVKKFTFYSQLLLDEFSLTEIRAKTKWWANKYAVQTGIKTHQKIGNDPIFLRAEFNTSRPYTYSHLSLKQSYTNNGSVLAHPLGANFYELLLDAKIQHKKWMAELFISYSLKGYDSTFNMGGNIFIPYINRPDEYGHTIGQGVHNNAFISLIRVNYRLLKSGALNAFVEYQNRYNTTLIQPNNQLIIGIRSRLWNDYRNY
ncbi:MAG: hypothetical protein N4A41_11575 [Crocinitomicaceae bacterium]|nr:hypothetical protein [Crocinitomicaceae bacterium]